MKPADTPSATPNTPSVDSHRCSATLPTEAALCATTSGNHWPAKTYSSSTQHTATRPTPSVRHASTNNSTRPSSATPVSKSVESPGRPASPA